ncbi:MAG: histidinol dehydrogenase [Clostridia bacterium]|nr:histidinol dehydrogenase [Clostridia bacterium]
MIKIYRMGEVPENEIFAREGQAANVEAAVSEIIANVRRYGDSALLDYTEKFDGVRLTELEVSAREINEALESLEPEFIRILNRAADNIRAFHKRQLRTGFIINDQPGIVMGQKVIPLDSAGLYVPGGTAAYPSTVLMDAIPAKLAGVGRLVITTPPGKDGRINPAILAAARIAGVDSIYKVGGAQAIAALAYGTQTIPRTDKIVGPGNVYVAEAKKQVFGQVAIDMIAGPSEILIISDAKSSPSVLAADLLSQAEHDKAASAVLVTNSEELALKVQDELERQLALLERQQIARASIDQNGKIIVTDDLETAFEAANRIAPEHLELCVDEPFAYLDKIRHAGSVFMGRNCPEALGDYMAGPNHTLPTGGTARFSSPLSVDDFVKKTQYTYFTASALNDLAQDVAYFAQKEGLTAHAKSALIRPEEEV